MINIKSALSIFVFGSWLSCVHAQSPSIDVAINIFGHDYKIASGQNHNEEYMWIFSTKSTELVIPSPTPIGIDPIPYYDLKLNPCYLTIETANKIIINTSLSGSGCIDFKMDTLFLRYMAVLFPSNIISE